MVFDCDGVLAETERHGHLAAFNQAFAEAGLDVEWSVRDYAALLHITGGKERMLTVFADREWVADHGLPADRAGQEELVAAWHRRKTEIFLDLARRGGLPARPGVARLAAEARAAGWEVAVASTAAEPSVQAIVQHVFPAATAAAVRVFAGDTVPRKKPAPDIYHRAFRELRRSPAEVCVIEDSRPGLLAAHGAGAGVIITPSQFTAGEDFSDAALVVDCLGTGERPMRVLSSRLPRAPGPMVTTAVCEAVMAVSRSGGSAGRRRSPGPAASRKVGCPAAGGGPGRERAGR